MDLEIPIEYRSQLKWITGLSRGTTCDDVIYALLRHDMGPNQNIDVSTYRMYEQWPDCERTLSGRTKITKLWRMLGQNARQQSVRLVIRQALTADILHDTGSEMSYGTRSRRAKRQQMKHAASFKQAHRLSGLTKSEVYEQYYRKEKRRRDLDFRPDAINEQAEDVYPYLELVASQQEQLQLLTNQISDMDTKIALYENHHRQSTCSDWQHTTQNGWMTSDAPALFPAIKANDVEAYLHMCESLVELHESIEQTHSKACYLTSVLAEERAKTHKSTPPPTPLASNEAEIQKTIYALYDEHTRSAALFRAQQHELRRLEQDMNVCEREIRQKDDVIKELTYLLHDVDNASRDDALRQSLDDDVFEQSSSQARDGKFDTVTSRQFTNHHRAGLSAPVSQTLDDQRQNLTNNNSSANFKSPRRRSSSTKTPSPLPNTPKSPSSQAKDVSERTKEVRFKSDVTKWLYDVLSEDDTQENNSKQLTSHSNVNSQYLPSHQRSTSLANTYANIELMSSFAQTTNTTESYKPRSYGGPANILSQSSLIPYGFGGQTYLHSDNLVSKHKADDSNSDTGLSSMNSEEDAGIIPLETLV